MLVSGCCLDCHHHFQVSLSIPGHISFTASVTLVAGVKPGVGKRIEQLLSLHLPLLFLMSILTCSFKVWGQVAPRW